MRYEDLSVEDQRLLNTDLGDFEKDAAEQVALADEMYSVGFSKLASETADYLDEMMAKTAESKEEEKEEEKDEETEKKAAELGAFIERGFFDGLRKLGQERHGDQTAYLAPFIEEKIAAAAAAEATEKWLPKAWKAFKGYHVGAAKNIAGHKMPPKAPGKVVEKLEGWDRAKSVGKGALKLSPYAAAGIGGEEAIRRGVKAHKKKKEERASAEQY